MVKATEWHMDPLLETPQVAAKTPRNPRDRQTDPYERDIQRAVVKQLRAVLPPDYIVRANVQEREGMGAGVFARAQGQVPGWPDIEVWGDGRVWLIELKAAKGTLSTAQKELHIRLQSAGACLLPICRSVEQAVDFLRKNGARFRGAVR